MTNLTIKNFTSPYELQRYFEEYGRGDNFELEHFEALYDLLNEICSDTVIDVISICCEFSGYDSIDDAVDDLGYKSRRELRDNTWVTECRNGKVLIQH